MKTIKVRVKGHTFSINVQTPDSVSLIMDQLHDQLEKKQYVRIPGTQIMYRCDTVEFVSVSETP